MGKLRLLQYQGIRFAASACPQCPMRELLCHWLLPLSALQTSVTSFLMPLVCSHPRRSGFDWQQSLPCRGSKQTLPSVVLLPASLLGPATNSQVSMYRLAGLDVCFPGHNSIHLVPSTPLAYLTHDPGSFLLLSLSGLEQVQKPYVTASCPRI